jgi:hypothetical protein
MSDTKIVPLNPTNLPAEFGEFFDVGEMGDDLSAGVAGGFPILSFRGKVWRIKHAGDELPVTNEDGDPVAGVELHFLKASPDISKVYYDHKYVEGSDEPPTCMSVDGIVPDAGSSSPQCATCAACEHNQWGSRMTEDGRKAKACQDSRRIAVVPVGDIPNEQHGGPMLLRVPAASLNDLKSYGLGMKNKGYPYNSIVTRVGFDMDAAYPKLTFKPIRPITNEEGEALTEWYKEASRIETVLSHAEQDRAVKKQETVAKKAPAKEEAFSLEFEGEETPEPKKPAPKKKAEPKQEVAEETSDEPKDKLAADLDSILAGLENG